MSKWGLQRQLRVKQEEKQGPPWCRSKWEWQGHFKSQQQEEEEEDPLRQVATPAPFLPSLCVLGLAIGPQP